MKLLHFLCIICHYPSKYCPVSNLSFLGKVVERITAEQHQVFLEDTQLYLLMSGQLNAAPDILAKGPLVKTVPAKTKSI